MKDEKVAIVDLGTNTFNLLVAEFQSGNMDMLVNERVGVRLGEGGISERRITSQAMERAFSTLENFRDTLAGYGIGPDKAILVGTSALRNASNADSFIKETHKRTGFTVHTVDGDREAYLIHEGVKRALRLSDDISLIIDIGGGSVEFIFCNESRVFWQRSLEIGAQRLIEKFQRHDPIRPEEIKELEAYLEKELTGVLEVARRFPPVEFIGSSGSFDTLAEVYEASKGILAQPHRTAFNLPTTEFELCYQTLVNKNRGERLRVPGMIPLRVDLIVVASCLIRFLLREIPVNNIRVSTYALKEGLMYMISEGRFRVE
ncbi:hypothetical protein FUAX_05640 [Fulvitalea axinellae]|uniref:Ppx/GppA phosphatase N-terminal domain-containing protein n=1 Tax=Fulvitalea axinellae TaxID=1182444 RepID=A0AAU9CMR5_9BACT|nr:hypothetical protein FUAX_05640 [Fulvitalea axinellae]